MGITYPLTVFLLYMSTRKCPACRVKQPAKPLAVQEAEPSAALSIESPVGEVQVATEIQSVDAPATDIAKA